MSDEATPTKRGGRKATIDKNEKNDSKVETKKRGRKVSFFLII